MEIVSPEEEIFKGEVTMVTLPGAAGSFTVLINHAPIVATLKKGAIIYVADAKEQTVDIEGGFMEMSNNVVSICVS